MDEKRFQSKPLPVRFANQVAYFFIALIVVFEEFVWKRVKALMERVARLPLFHQLEAWIGHQHRAVILLLFLVPFSIMHAVQLGALALTGSGHFKEGVLLYIVAKIVGYFFITRLLVIGQDKLMTFKAFAFGYNTLIAFKEFIYSQPAWQKVKTLLLNVRLKMHNWKLSVLGRGRGFWVKIRAMRKAAQKDFRS